MNPFRRYLQIYAGIRALNLINLNYELSSIPECAFTENLPRKGIAVRLASFCFRFLRSLRRPFHAGSTRIPPRAILIFAVAKNEEDSLASVSSDWKDAIIVGTGKSAANDFPLAASYVLSLPFLPLVIKHLLAARGFARKSFSYNFDGYLHTYGLYVAARHWLRKLKPRCVVLSNPVATRHRVLTQAARDESIPTVYLQHASAHKLLPPLEYDYALLDGWDALEKYERIGRSTSVVFMVGVPKLDAYFSAINCRSTVRTVGVATNALDSLTTIEELCKRLGEAFPDYRLVLRPHPSDRRFSDWEKLARRSRFQFSDPTIEHPMEFLRQLDAMIAGDSNILLEAALLNVAPIYYDGEKSGLDWYDFARNGLAERFTDPDSTISYISSIADNRESVRSRAKRYSATIGTSFDGRSGELAQTVIAQLLSGKPATAFLWRRVPNTDLTAWELNPQASTEEDEAPHQQGNNSYVS
jgi:hypothetical protein